MIEKIMKAVKSGNKKRGRNITIGAVVGFLLSCTAVMGADEYLWIKNDGSGIKFNTAITTDKEGAGGNWNEDNPYSENSWDGTTYTNNMTLSSTAANGIDSNSYDISYGLGLSGDLTGKSFINNGIINGIANSDGSAFGIYTTDLIAVRNITNNGIIIGSVSIPFTSDGLGVGIYVKNSKSIVNRGIVKAYGGEHNNSEGIQVQHDSATIENITNEGIISGYGGDYTNGHGIAIYYTNVDYLTNNGIIYGDRAIFISRGNVDFLKNYGILASGGLTTEGPITSEENYGLYIAGLTGTVTVGTAGNGGNGGKETVKIGDLERKMIIKNAELEGVSGSATATKSIAISGTETYDSYIFNGKDKTLKISGTDNEITDSIINAYGTAVVFDTAAGGELILSGTMVNGRVDGTSDAIIEGSGEKDILILQSGIQNTIVNGNIDMKTGNDELTLGDGTIINGIIAGGTGSDILNFGSAARAVNNDEINIQHNISGFENININANVTFNEKAINVSGTIESLKVTDVENITIGANGVLTLRIDSANNNKHALSIGNTGTIKSENGGKLLLALNGAGLNEKISFGNLELDSSLVTGYEGEYQEDVTFGTTSVLHSVKRTGGTNEVEVAAKKDLPSKASGSDELFYEKLNKIYHSILSVDELGNFNVDNDEKLSTFLGYLNDIYAGKPYSYSSELSRKSAGMFRDIVTENIFKPETNKWMIYGGLTHVDGGTKDTYYGKGYYTYDIGSSDIDADTKITGAYMLGEYGVSDTLTSGVVIGGNKLKSDLSNGSKVDGSALYLGAYAKKYIGNLKVTVGAGFQYGDYDADRLAVNNAASSIGIPVIKYSDNYNDMTYDIYLNGRYSHSIGDNLFLEPYATLSYTYIDQDGADEGNQTLAIETDSKSFDYTVGKIGVDLKKVIPHEKGKSTLSAGVSYTKILDGADEEFITGRFKGGSNFDILVAHKNEHSIGLNAKYALELENGILFDVKGTYAIERDSHNRAGKNKTKGEWIVGAGLGYKF
ncbi:autotransporter outer membrane beta-barrel domain-containing protein [Fusobacterium varium]|uniref:autotransporter family protein n=1 Tax=Fusobacterium TaxID=848 RepID=UPI0030D56A86